MSFRADSFQITRPPGGSRPAILLAVVLLLVFPVDAQTVYEFEVAGMSCGHCAKAAREVLEEVEGVDEATVDFDSRRARVTASGDVGRDDLEDALAELGFEARFPGETVVPALTESQKEGLDIAVVSRGERFDIEDHLAEGKITMFDFWAEWCGPCHLLTPKLERLVYESEGKIALRTIDLVRWDSEAAKQATEEFRLPGLPYVRVYGPEGEFIGYVVGNQIEKVEAVIAKGAR